MKEVDYGNSKKPSEEKVHSKVWRHSPPSSPAALRYPSVVNVKDRGSLQRRNLTKKVSGSIEHASTVYTGAVNHSKDERLEKNFPKRARSWSMD